MTEKLPIAEVSKEFKAEMAAILKRTEEQGNIEGLAIMDEAGEHALGVLVPPATYNLQRHIADMLQNPDEHGFKVKRYWDTGPKMSVKQAFGEETVSAFFKFRENFYERRVQLYRALHIRPRLRPRSPAPA